MVEQSHVVHAVARDIEYVACGPFIGLYPNHNYAGYHITKYACILSPYRNLKT